MRREHDVAAVRPHGGENLAVEYLLSPGRVRALIAWRQEEFPVALPFLTSELALDRARTAPDLLLRSEQEWRLREQFVALGLDVYLRSEAGPTLLPEVSWSLGPERTRARRLPDGAFAIQQRDGSSIRVATIEDVLDHLATS